MSGDTRQVLMSIEAEGYIDSLEVIDIKEIGNIRWSKQHEYIEKLNMQAILSASTNEEEFVKEYLITSEKIPVLIQELIAVDIWKLKVFPMFEEIDFTPKISFPIYVVLFHEATLINLLETVMFHREACEAADDVVLDLAEYCYEKLTSLIARTKQDDSENEETEITVDSATTHSLEELEKQNKKLNFDISIKAISILRYITDALPSLSLSVMTRLLNTQDVPLLLIELIENPPWTRRKDGKIMKYIERKWEEVSHPDSFKLTKTEGQVWIAIYHLLMSQDCQQKYELNSYRKNTILKLRTYLTEVMLDQMPVLGEMRRYLEQLSMMDPPPFKKDLVLEQVPEIRENILKKYSGKWKSLAKKQSKTVFDPSNASLRGQAERLAATYNTEMLESLINEPPKCAVCGELASKRCSRCQNEWYCRRECQVKHWPKHKQACNLLVDSMEKIKLQEQDTSKQSSLASHR